MRCLHLERDTNPGHGGLIIMVENQGGKSRRNQMDRQTVGNISIGSGLCQLMHDKLQ